MSAASNNCPATGVGSAWLLRREKTIMKQEFHRVNRFLVAKVKTSV